MADSVITVTLNPCLDKMLVVDRLRPNSLNRVRRTETDPGGKGVNAARVLGSLGTPVTATGFVAGGTGEALVGFLRRARITVDFMEIPGETRTNFKIFDERIKKTTEINEPGCPVSPADLAAFMQKLDGLLRHASALVLSGSLPPAVPPDVYARFIAQARRRGVKTVLDTAGDAFRRGLTAEPFAVKPNIHELEELAGRPLKTLHEILGTSRELIRAGVGLVMVSMGADGAVVADAREAYKTDAWHIEERGATGAGDSMVAALTGALVRGASLADIARTATAAGTVTASKPGTRLCTRAEVLAALPLVTVRRLPEWPGDFPLRCS